MDQEVLRKIERDILLLSLIAWLVAFYAVDLHGAVSVVLGGTVALLNFTLIHRGVRTLLSTATENARKRFLVLSWLKFIAIAIGLGLVFFFVHPSVILFLIGFSLFIPSVIFETLITHDLVER